MYRKIFKRLSTMILCLICTGCHRDKVYQSPPLTDDPIEVRVDYAPLEDLAPAYGVAVRAEHGLQFEVSVEAEDSLKLKVGEQAEVFLLPSKQKIPSRITRVLRNASSETGQALAWLIPTGSTGAAAGDFIFSHIVVSRRDHVLVAPNSAILIRNGKTWVVQKTKQKEGAETWVPAEITTGLVTSNGTEVISGVTAGALLATQGALGFLSPDFKAGAD